VGPPLNVVPPTAGAKYRLSCNKASASIPFLDVVEMGVLHGIREPVHVGWLYSVLGTTKSVIKSHVLPG